MKASIKLGKIYGIEIGLHYSWLIIAVLISLSLSNYFAENHPDWSKNVIWAMAVSTALPFFPAIVLHELSHAAVARPLETLHIVPPEMPVNEALEIIGREGVNQFPVISNEKLQGIISREQIINYLFTRRELNL